MNSSKMSNIILDSDDDEMDDIIAEFAEEEGKEQVIHLSESEDEIDNLIEEFAAEIHDVDVEMGATCEESSVATANEIDDLIEEFAAEIHNVDVEMGATCEESSVATANDTVIGDRDCTVISDKNNHYKNIYSDKGSVENSSSKDTKEACDSIKSSSRNEIFSSSSETDLSKTTPDNYVTGNENSVVKNINPPIIILKCESLNAAGMSYSCSELSAFTNHPFNNDSRQSIPNKSTNENFLDEFKCDTTKNSDLNVCDKEVHKNCSTENNGIVNAANDTADSRECIAICDKDKYKNTYAISSVEILEENSSLTEPSDSIDISGVDSSSITIDDVSKPSHNMASNNNTYAISSVEILEENSSLTEPSDSIDISGVDSSSITIDDVSKPSHNMASNNNTYAISSVEILEENSSLTEPSDSIDISGVDSSSITIDDVSKPSHNMASNNNTYAISSVEILEENSSLTELSDKFVSGSMDISDIDASSLTINDMSEPSHNTAPKIISVSAVPESKSFCGVDTQESISNRVTITITPEKLNSEENTATENNQNLVDEGTILLENSTCANSEYNRTDDAMNLSERESHSKCIENLESNDTKLAQSNGVVDKDSSVATGKLNCLKTVAEEYVVSAENKANNDASENAFVQNSDENYSASQIIASSVLCESPNVSSDVEVIGNSNSINDKLIISSNKDAEKNLMSRTSEEIYSEESFLKHREELIVEIQSFISTAYDSSLKKDNIDSIYKRDVIDNLELSGNIDEKTSNSERSSISSDERDLSKKTQEGTNEIEEKTNETEERMNEIEEQTNEIGEKTNETEERTNEITVEGSSDVSVLHQQESSITNESIQASAPEILKSSLTRSEINVIDSKEVLEEGISERNKRILEISKNEFSCKKLKNDVSHFTDSNESIQVSAPEILKPHITKNSEINAIDSKEVLQKGISERNKRILEISENEISCKRLKSDVITVIDSNEGSLDLPEDFSSMKHTNKEDKYKVIALDLEPVDKIKQQIPWNPHWKIEATRKTLDRIALNVSEGFVKKYYEKECRQMRDDIRKLKGLIENFKDVTQDLLNVAKEFRASQKVSFASSGYQEITYRTVGTNVKIKKKEGTLNEGKAAEKTPEMISDQKQDVPPTITILNVSGNISDPKQENVSPTITILNVSGNVSDQKQGDVSPEITILNVSGNISDQKQDDISHVLTIPTSSGIVSDQKKREGPGVIIIPKASGIISNQKQQKVSPVVTIPKASTVISGLNQDIFSHIKIIPRASGIVSNQNPENTSVISIPKAAEIVSHQKQEDVPHIKAIPKVSEIGLPKNFTSSCINLSCSHGGASEITSFIPTPLPYVMEGDRLVPYIEPSKPLQSSKPFVMPLTTAVTTVTNSQILALLRKEPLPSSKPFVMPLTTAITTVTNSQITALQRKEPLPSSKPFVMPPTPSVTTVINNQITSLQRKEPLPFNKSCVMPLTTAVTTVTNSHITALQRKEPLPFSKSFVMPLTTAITTVTNSQITALERKEPLPFNKSFVMPLTTAVTTATNSQITALQRKEYEQKGAVPNGVLHPLNSIPQLFRNVQPFSVPQRATLPLKFHNITSHLTQGNIRRMTSFPSHARQLQYLQMNPTGSGVNLNHAGNSITRALSHKPHGPSVGIVNHHPQQDSQSQLYYQVPRFNPPPMPVHQKSHVPCQNLSVTMTHSSKVMHQLPNLAHCRPTYVHTTASPVISRPLSFIYNSAPVNQHHPMSYQPPSVSAHNNPLLLGPTPTSSHNNPLLLGPTPTSSSSLNSLPVSYLPSGHNNSEKGRNSLPIPIVKGSMKDNGSVVISWDLESLEQHSNIAFYQLYSSQVKHPQESPPVWKSVGDVASLDLPMACTLNHFEANNYYHFAVRVVDKLKNFGPFSEPVTLYYSGKKSPKL